MISKAVLIRLFSNGLRPSIRTQAKQDSRQKNTWKQAIKKAITAEAKATLNHLSWIREIYACYPWGHWSSLKPEKCIKEKGFNHNYSMY